MDRPVLTAVTKKRVELVNISPIPKSVADEKEDSPVMKRTQRIVEQVYAGIKRTSREADLEEEIVVKDKRIKTLEHDNAVMDQMLKAVSNAMKNFK
jgi:hypothetical protein